MQGQSQRRARKRNKNVRIGKEEINLLNNLIV
jgi:hypothetical protein